MESPQASVDELRLQASAAPPPPPPQPPQEAVEANIIKKTFALQTKQLLLHSFLGNALLVVIVSVLSGILIREGGKIAQAIVMFMTQLFVAASVVCPCAT